MTQARAREPPGGTVPSGRVGCRRLTWLVQLSLPGPQRSPVSAPGPSGSLGEEGAVARTPGGGGRGFRREAELLRPRGARPRGPLQGRALPLPQSCLRWRGVRVGSVHRRHSLSPPPCASPCGRPGSGPAPGTGRDDEDDGGTCCSVAAALGPTSRPRWTGQRRGGARPVPLCQGDPPRGLPADRGSGLGGRRPEPLSRRVWRPALPASVP